ncbi:hypothetical protein [Actinomadura flavalba]|uniref:hypothetical protein n=1 Tax=Actinomadura flavalba TaxID=1120938 RepID=UPI0012DE741D|nr:hypothetical protein [Actinomadura flavalba]
METTRSATYQLADLRIDGGLEGFVRPRRENGASWRQIANDLRDQQRVDVTEVTLRAWFGDQPWAARKRRRASGRRDRARRRPLEHAPPSAGRQLGLDD